MVSCIMRTSRSLLQKMVLSAAKNGFAAHRILVHFVSAGWKVTSIHSHEIWLVDLTEPLAELLRSGMALRMGQE